MTFYPHFFFLRGWLIGIWLVVTSLAACAQTDNTFQPDNAELRTQPHLKRPDSLLLAFKSKYTRSVEQKDNVAAANYLQEMGRICYHLGRYPQALDLMLQAGALYRREGKQKPLADNLNEIGILYYYIRQPQRAREQYDEALSIYQALNDKAGVAVTSGKIGHLYEKQRQFDKAFFYQRQALRQYSQLADKRGMAKIYENLGSIYEDLPQYDSARYYFENALLLYQQTNDETSRIEVINNLGDVLRKTGNYREGLLQTRRALALAQKTGETYQLNSAYYDMAKAFNGMGANDSAYYYLALSRKYQTTIYSEESNKQLALLETLYDIERKNSEIDRLNSDRQVTNIITVASVLGFILLVALGSVFISRQRLKLQTEQAANEQNTRIYEKQNELMQAELKNQKLDLDVRTKELSTHTLHIIQKNQLLDDLRGKIEELVTDDKRDQKKQLKQILHQINQNANHDQHWDEFRTIFEQVHQTFFDRLKEHSDSLTATDLRLVSLLKLNYNSADIATLLGISQDSLRVMRYRLRKKLSIQPGDNLTTFIQAI